jgi:hypothetical protein
MSNIENYLPLLRDNLNSNNRDNNKSSNHKNFKKRLLILEVKVRKKEVNSSLMNKKSRVLQRAKIMNKRRNKSRLKNLKKLLKKN